MEALEVWWRWIKNVVINHWVWIASIVATTGLALSPLIADQDIRKVIVTIGSVVLASGIAGAVIRSSTFTDMFIARIVDVFYEGKHLRSRKDMKEICTRTLNALLESESPALRGAVGSELLNGYLDFKLGYIYRDFSVQIEVKGLDRDTGVMEILETTTAIIVPNPGVAQITLHWAWFSLGHTSAKADLLTISIDGDKIDLAKLHENEQAIDNRGFSYRHALKNTSTESEDNGIVYVKRAKKFIDLRQDPVTIYKFRAPCLGMSVTLLDFPESDLECDVQAFGLPEEFRPDRSKEDLQGHWRNQKYSRLIFPKQGVMLQWNVLRKE